MKNEATIGDPWVSECLLNDQTKQKTKIRPETFQSLKCLRFPMSACTETYALRLTACVCMWEQKAQDPLFNLGSVEQNNPCLEATDPA